MSWGLSEREIALLRATLAAHPNVQRAVLYGSRAMGHYRTGSDIDNPELVDHIRRVSVEFWRR